MKYLLYLFVLLNLLSIKVNGQKEKIYYTLTESTIMRDTSGVKLPYSLWHTLLKTGKYSFKAKNPDNESTEFIFYRLNEEQLQKHKEGQEKLKYIKPFETEYFVTGKPFHPLFSDKDLNGNKYSIKKLKGKIIVLNFWYIKCTPCRSEIPELNDLVDSFKDHKEVVFISVCLDKKWDIEDFIKQTPFKYNIIPDARDLAMLYEIKDYPTNVIIDQEGLVYFHTFGFALSTKYWLNKSINELLAKQPVEHKSY